MRKGEFLYMQNLKNKLNNIIYNKDKENNINPWLITRENETTYKIESKRDRRYFTNIYKKDCYIQDGQLYFSQYPLNAVSESHDYAFAPFYSYDLEEDSTKKSDFNCGRAES